MKKKILPIVMSLIFLGLAVVVVKYVVLKKSATAKWHKKITSSKAKNNAFLNQYLAQSFVKQQDIPQEFIECFSSISLDVRQNAIIVLRNLGKDFNDQSTIDEILYITLEDSSQQVRRETALALMNRENLRIDKIKRAYNLEKDPEIQCYLGGMIALSFETNDIHVLNEHLQNSKPEYMRVVLNSYITYHQKRWDSISSDMLAAFVAEVAPTLETSSLKEEIGQFLQKITKVNLPADKYAWFSWVTSVHEHDIANLGQEQLRDLFFSSEVKNAKKFPIAQKLKIYPKNIPLFLGKVLQNNGQLHYIFSQIKERYYHHFVTFIHLHHTNSRYLVDFLLAKNTTFSNDFLMENMDSLAEEERNVLLKQIQENPDKSSYEVTIFGDGKQIQILKSTNNLSNTEVVKPAPQVEVTPNKQNDIVRNKQNDIVRNKQNDKTAKKTVVATQLPPQQLVTLTSQTQKGTVKVPMVYHLKAHASTDVAQVKITVVIPKTVTYLRSEPFPEVNGQSLTWRYDVIPQGENKNIRVWLMPTAGGKQSFFSFVKATPANRSSVIIGEPQLQATISGPKHQNIASPFSYQLRVKNTGNGEAHEVVASFALPDGFSHESAEQNLVFPIGVIKAGEEKIINTKVIATMPGEQCCEININSANHPLVTKKFCCKIAKKDFRIAIENESRCSIEGQALINVTVSNTGNKDLEDIKLHANFLPQNKIISHDISQATVKENSIVGVQDIIPVGEQATFSILIASSKIGEQCFSVEAVHQQKKHQAKGCITWQQAPKLKIIHRGPQQVTRNEKFTCEIIVQNIGEVDAKDIVVAIIAPQLQCDQMLFTIDNLKVKDEKRFEIDTKALQIGDVKSVAHVECKGMNANEDCVVFFVVE
ncbi:COG1470 family protein [Candidatus Uabimicrobium amorphum]|uniref:Large cysteine-rich periplasmic protein OmcB n=1 Tax=Uabimicrobium amorphum TaxID=2596890 RepID=A0A5S9IPH3_UABAM|nr:hypothetical protein [Candidatus Uabimicrobium amorphum]BBM85494.1 large cysteine-rich periplasmic protein OmcB [Candidatus Uabimicrobium amorphum]